MSFAFVCVCVCVFSRWRLREIAMLVCPDGASCESVALDKPALDSSRATEVYSAFGRGFGCSLSFLIADREELYTAGLHSQYTRETSPPVDC